MWVKINIQIHKSFHNGYKHNNSNELYIYVVGRLQQLKSNYWHVYTKIWGIKQQGKIEVCIIVILYV